MTESIVKYQGPDGMWRTSLNGPTWIAQPESSSTGFFTFGLLVGSELYMMKLTPGELRR